MTTDRQRELAQLIRALRSGNYNGQTIRRFRQLVKEEVTPIVAEAVPRIMAERRQREAARRAGQQAGMAAGRRFAERLQREREREAADAWRRIAERRGR